MNEEQNIPGQTEAESENSKTNDDYYEIDKHKKIVISSIGDGEMRNEGTVGTGDIPEESSLFNPGPADEQDKAELRDSGD